MPPKKSKKKKTKRVKKVAEIPTAPEAELPDLAQYQNLPIPQDENERIELANQLKTGGNRYYAAAEYEKAIELYSKSISLHQAYKTFGNRSAAYLKVGKYNDAVADASFCTKNRAQVNSIKKIKILQLQKIGHKTHPKPTFFLFFLLRCPALLSTVGQRMATSR